ncbi:hypothetical protein [Nocardia sp. NPDC057227]|uniref:hypothetical protein n=1 Tax=Nocardia sp. NPDC057227 TaxID=3346056 RepID=UPI0036381B47
MPASENEPAREVPVAEVIGANARRIRGEHTADQMSRHAQWAGLKWNTGRVADLEKGRISPTLPNLVAIAAALRSLTGQDVTLADLVAHDGPIRLNDVLVMPAARLAGYLRGELVRVFASETPALAAEAEEARRVVRRWLDNREDWLEDLDQVNAWQAAMHNATDADERAAADLGLSVAEMLARSVEMWGRGFSAERDARAGDGASNQKRGRIARTLKDELRQAISDGDD